MAEIQIECNIAAKRSGFAMSRYCRDERVAERKLRHIELRMAVVFLLVGAMTTRMLGGADWLNAVVGVACGVIGWMVGRSVKRCAMEGLARIHE